MSSQSMSSQPTSTNPSTNSSATPSTPPPPPGEPRPSLSPASTNNNYSVAASNLVIVSIDFSTTILPAPTSFTLTSLTSQFRRPQPPSRASSCSSSSSSPPPSPPSPTTLPSRQPPSNSAPTTRTRQDRVAVAEAQSGSEGGREREAVEVAEAEQGFFLGATEVMGTAPGGTGRREPTRDQGSDNAMERLESDLARLALRTRSPPRSVRATSDASGGSGGTLRTERTRRQPSGGEEETASLQGRQMPMRRQPSSGEEERASREARWTMGRAWEREMGVREERREEGGIFPPARWGLIANRLLAQAQSVGLAAARVGVVVVGDVVAWGLEAARDAGGDGGARERRQQDDGEREESEGEDDEEESETQDYVRVPILADEEQEEHEALCGRVCPLRDRSGEEEMDDEEWQVVLFR